MATILIIDDDKTTRTLMEAVFAVEDHVVFCAPNGPVGIARFKKEMPEIVFVDLFMPKVNGIQVIQSLRKVSADAYIVAMSGGVPGKHPAGTFLEYAKQNGANDALQKPLHKQVLLEILRNRLEQGVQSA